MNIQEALAAQLQALGVKKVLLQMAKNGQILELNCEMPTCYCDHPDRRRHFDPWPEPNDPELSKWSPNADHSPDRRTAGAEAVEHTPGARLLQQPGLRLA
jgi:hypothetical protein